MLQCWRCSFGKKKRSKNTMFDVRIGIMFINIFFNKKCQIRFVNLLPRDHTVLKKGKMCMVH